MGRKNSKKTAEVSETTIAEEMEMKEPQVENNIPEDDGEDSVLEKEANQHTFLTEDEAEAYVKVKNADRDPDSKIPAHRTYVCRMAGNDTVIYSVERNRKFAEANAARRFGVSSRPLHYSERAKVATAESIKSKAQFLLRQAAMMDNVEGLDAETAELLKRLSGKLAA